MNKSRELVEMGNLYTEKVTFPPKGTFELASDTKEKKKPFVGKTSGPEAADGFKKEAVTDPKVTKNKETFQDVKNFSSEKFNENVGKSETKNINNYMSNIFDKLFEDVMGLSQDDQDAKDLGLTPEVGGEVAPEVGGEEVTITLDKATAQKLHDLLMAAIGGEEEKKEDEGSDEGEASDESEDAEENAEEKKKHGEDEEEEEDAEEIAGEATELKEVPASAGHSLQSKNNKVGDVTAGLVAKGGGDGKVTDKVGNDGDKGHALVGAGVKGGAPTSPKGKANVVPGKASNVGQYITQK